MKLLKNVCSVSLIIWAGLIQLAAAEEGFLNIINEKPNVLIEVPVSRSIVAQSAFPFSDVAIADPKIADFSILSDTSIYILGKKPGQTTLTFLNQNDELISNISVKVTMDVSELQQHIDEIFSDHQIDIRTAADVIILSGAVDTPLTATKIISLAERYAPGKVSSLLSVKDKKPLRIEVDFIQTNRSFERYLTASDFEEKVLIGNSLKITRGEVKNIKHVIRLPLFSKDTEKMLPSEEYDFEALLAFKAGVKGLQKTLDALETEKVISYVDSQEIHAFPNERISIVKSASLSMPTNEDGHIQVSAKELGINLGVSLSLFGNESIPIALDLELITPENTDELKMNNASVISIEASRIGSDFVLQDGQKIALVGLFKSYFDNSKKSITWMNEIPLLAKFIKMDGFKRGESGLLVIISVHINDLH